MLRPPSVLTLLCWVRSSELQRIIIITPGMSGSIRSLEQGSPTSVPQISARKKVMHVNVQKTSPSPTLTLVYGKMVFCEIGPWCQERWGTSALQGSCEE